MKAVGGGRARRAARCAALAAAAASLAAGLVAPGAGAQESDEPLVLPDSFGGAASAPAVGIELLTPPLIPVQDLFAVQVAEGRGTYEPSSRRRDSGRLRPCPLCELAAASPV